VQETSHVYRDEADAAQTVYNKRLIPLAKGDTFFSLADLQDYIKNLPSEEVFVSGIGAVSIENPVRRAEGRVVPLGEIRKISEYCRANNIKLHLDGARLFLASAWTGVSIKEYASFFDTVYISLYKYLGASGGAMLCGEKSVIDKMPHLIKVHGGSMYGNWTNAAMALNRLEGFEGRIMDAIERADKVFAALNKIPDILIKPLEGGTNIYSFKLGKGIDGKEFREKMNKDFNILIPRLENNEGLISVNETLLYKPEDYIIGAFRKAMQSS
jgi:threonine aldolase